MKALKIILIVILVLIIGFVAFLVYMGVFSNPKAYEGVTGPYTMAYEEFVGDYKKSGVVFDKVFKQLKADGIETTRAIGIYFDDPRKVPVDKLRSHCGIVVENKDLGKFAKVKSKYKVKQIKKHKSIIVEFPIKNMMSYMIAPMKCYTILVNYAKEKGYQMTMPFEFYDMPGKKILFIMELKKK